jgi:3',5'-cyclic AMP phosphodiesterase CpdA
MKILVYSDLHLEFDSFTPKKEWLNQVDLVVQVGDLHFAPNNIKILRTWGVPVLFVPGNHDFWNPVKEVHPTSYGWGYPAKEYRSVYERHLDLAIQQMREEADGSMVRVLYNDTVEIGGIQFIGTTLWYEGLKLNRSEVSTINDYQRMFASPTQLITPSFIDEEHQRAVAFIKDALNTPFEGKRALLTHHPAWIPPVVWDQEHCAKAYGTDLTPIWRERVDLLVHGHVHDAIDTRYGKTHIVCNPRGYPSDDTRRTFKKQLIVNL